MVKEIVEYTKKLKPVTDFEDLKVGDKIFNINSLDLTYVDTFMSYDKISNWVVYKNYYGELWGCRVRENEWFYVMEDSTNGSR